MKWLFKGVLGLAVIAVAVVTIVPMVIDEAEIRQQIESEAAKKGVELEISQPLQIGLFPQLQLALKELVVHPNAQQQIPRVVVEELLVEVALWPLLEQRLEVTQLQATIDGAQWQGHATLSQQRETTQVRFQLKGEQLDLDRYLPKGQVVDPIAGSAAGVSQLPFEPLRALDLDGVIELEKLSFSDVEATQLHFPLRVAQGVVQVGPSRANLYGGHYLGTMEADIRGEQPLIRLEESLQAVDLNQLATAFAGWDALHGGLTLEGEATTTGIQPKTLLRNLKGSAKVTLKEGAIEGINLKQVVAQTQALLERKPMPPQHGPNETRFEQLTASLRVDQGRLKSDDLKVEIDAMQLEGAGWVDLVSEEIEYRLTASVAESLTADQQRTFGKLAGQQFPVLVYGTLRNPQLKVNLDDLIKRGLRKQLQKRVGEKLQELLGDVQGGSSAQPPDLNRLLQKLF